MILWICLMMFAGLSLDRQRMAACYIFALPSLLYHLTPDKFIPDSYVYSIGAALDLIVLIFISKLINQSIYSMALAALAGISIIGNIAGFAMYWAYLEPDPYNNFYSAYYAVALLITSLAGLHGGISRTGRSGAVVSGHVDERSASTY